VSQARLGQHSPGLESFVKAHPDILRCKWEVTAAVQVGSHMQRPHHGGVMRTLHVTPAPKTDLRTKMRKT